MGNEGSRPGGGGKKNNFKGRGNTLGTAADAIAARRAREAAQKPQAQARRVVTQKDRDARAAALAAAESRANKFDNRLKKKRQQRKEKSKEKLLERSGSSDGGTAKASFLNQGLAQKLPAQRTVDLGFDPTKSVMSSSSTGRAIQSKIVNGDLRSNDEVSVQGGTGFSQPRITHRIKGDQQVRGHLNDSFPGSKNPYSQPEGFPG